MSLSDLWTLPIRVESHARERILQRLGWDDPDRVRAEVRLGLIDGRASETQPKWTNPGSRDPRPGRFYVWDDSFSRCWIVQTAQAESLIVVTVLLDRGGRAAAAERRHLLR